MSSCLPMKKMRKKEKKSSNDLKGDDMLLEQASSPLTGADAGSPRNISLKNVKLTVASTDHGRQQMPRSANRMERRKIFAG